MKILFLAVMLFMAIPGLADIGFLPQPALALGPCASAQEQASSAAGTKQHRGAIRFAGHYVYRASTVGGHYAYRFSKPAFASAAKLADRAADAGYFAAKTASYPARHPKRSAHYALRASSAGARIAYRAVW